MHCNELQLRGVKVEAMAIKFEQRVAEEVAKAGFRAKPGPRHNKEIKGTIGRGKTNHNSEWTSGFWKKIRRKSNFSNGAADEAEERRGR